MSFIQDLVVAFNKGGFWMWLILALHIVSIVLIVERTIVLFFKLKPNGTSHALKFEEYIKKGEVEKVYLENRTHETAISKTIAAGAKAAMELGGKDEIQGKMDEVLMHENSNLEKRVGFLAMLGNVATLTGLLGTISGLITSFASLTNASPQEKAALLSSGIAEAMYTTEYGLIVAIPALIMYAIFVNRQGNLAEDLNQGALKVFHWLSYNYNPVNVKSISKD